MSVADNTTENIITTKTGAKTSHTPDYSQLPTEGLIKAANRFALGAEVYGRDNWRKGLADYSYLRKRWCNAFGHLIHLRDVLDKLESGITIDQKDLDDDLGALLWFCHTASCHDSVKKLDAMREAQP